MNIDLYRLKTFYIVGRESNLSKASEILNVTQSTVSRSIMEIENEMDTQLITRTSRGVKLTAQGERVYEFAKKIFQEVDLFEKNFFEEKGDVHEVLKIATTPMLGIEWLVPRLDKFMEDNPHVRVKILLRLEKLDLSDADVVIRTPIPNHPHLIQKHVDTPSMKLFASKEYLRKFGTPQNPEDLDNHKLITYQGDMISPYGNANWVLHLGRDKQQLPRKSYLEINSLAGMFQCALRGKGIVSLPTYPSILNSGLKIVLPQVKGPEIPIYYIFPEQRMHSERIENLYQYLIEKELENNIEIEKNHG